MIKTLLPILLLIVSQGYAEDKVRTFNNNDLKKYEWDADNYESTETTDIDTEKYKDKQRDKQSSAKLQRCLKKAVKKYERKIEDICESRRAKGFLGDCYLGRDGPLVHKLNLDREKNECYKQNEIRMRRIIGE